jgi:hypothetical protein
MGKLSGRLAQIEKRLIPPERGTCRGCGLPHASIPIPLSIASAIVQYGLGRHPLHRHGSACVRSVVAPPTRSRG